MMSEGAVSFLQSDEQTQSGGVLKAVGEWRLAARSLEFYWDDE